MKFRKSIKIAKGVRVNIGKKGVSSVSVGGKGLTLNASKKGIKATASLPGTGLSHSEMVSTSSQKKRGKNVEPSSDITGQATQATRKVGLLLGLGIFFMPYIFSWFTLRPKHSAMSRIISFSWLIWLLYAISQKP